MDKNFISGLSGAVNEFQQARKRAVLQNAISRFLKKPDKLLSFEDVSRKLNLTGPWRRYLDNIPLDSIIGSVGRYVDFNRQFLPLRDDDQERWARVRVAIEERGLPPIEVYKIGETYFVLDGNHRVSVAHQLGSSYIEAFVNEFKTKVPLSPKDDEVDVLLKAELTELLEETGLNIIRPEIDFRLTIRGRYREIYEHICVHRYYMGIEQKRDITKQEAVASWVDNVYLPVIEVIREAEILDDFPGRTEADLYLWLKRHQAELLDHWGKDVDAITAAHDLSFRFSPKLTKVWGRLVDRVLKLFRGFVK